MSKKVTIIMLSSFVLALGAGTLLGMGLAHHEPPVRGPGGGRPSLETELELTPSQVKDVQAIQKNIREKYYADPRAQFSKLFEERNNAIKKILTSDQQKAFEALDKDFKNKMDTLRDSMNQQREIGEREEESQIKAVLTGSQKTKYENFLTKRKERRRPPAPASEPATRPSGDNPAGLPSYHP